jgi:hypothetical protein
MRDTLPPPTERPRGPTPSPAPVQTVGHRSGQGSASVLEHLVQDRLRHSDKSAPSRERRS